jgi:hypothetical protein
VEMRIARAKDLASPIAGSWDEERKSFEQIEGDWVEKCLAFDQTLGMFVEKSRSLMVLVTSS